MDVPPPVDTDADVFGYHGPRYGVELEHDYEASGSGSQTADPWISALYGALPPATYATSWEQDPWELRTHPADAESVGRWDPWAAGTGMQHMYPESQGYEDMGEGDDGIGEKDLGDMSPQRRVQPHRDGKGIAAPRLSPSGRRRRQ